MLTTQFKIQAPQPQEVSAVQFETHAPQNCVKNVAGLFDVIKSRATFNEEFFVSMSAKSQKAVPPIQNADGYFAEPYTMTASNQGFLIGTNIKSQAESNNPKEEQSDSIPNTSSPISPGGADDSTHNTNSCFWKKS